MKDGHVATSGKGCKEGPVAAKEGAGVRDRAFTFGASYVFGMPGPQAPAGKASGVDGEFSLRDKAKSRIK